LAIQKVFMYFGFLILKVKKFNNLFSLLLLLWRAFRQYGIMAKVAKVK